ncbi:MAG: MBOAT family protein, partial [Rhodospirillales bacterium]|nr:MBOAT family protein [Rhodospirillales bacterium]
MLFHTIEFAIFFAIVYPLYLILPHRLQNRMLLVASYVFYGWWDWRFLSLLVISSITDYLCALGIEASDQVKRRKLLVGVSVVVNAGLLGTFKYYDFFASEFQALMGGFGLQTHPYFLDIALPIGISFYTFQTMSYTIDVYRKKLPATRHLLDFGLYVSFFPQLIAGPIERGTRFLPQVLKPRVVNLDMIYRGLYFILWGLFLKVVVADNLSGLVDPVFNKTDGFAGAEVLVAAYAFSFQIYCDFAGYSFIALGLALMMGFQLMENFRRPYFSRNIADFWRRWHISLSSWFRDYVFTPLYIFIEKRPFLKSLKMKKRHAIAFFGALMVAEYMLGLWHGAGWNFGLFGIFHGLMIWAYYAFKKPWDSMPVALQMFLMYQVACVGWVIFRAPTLSQAIDMLASVAVSFTPSDPQTVLKSAMMLAMLIVPLTIIQAFQDRRNNT